MAGAKSGFCSSDGIYYSKRQAITLPLDPFLTLPRYLFERPEFDASAVAYLDSKTGLRLSYGELQAQVRTVAAGLLQFGISRGDVVFLISFNSLAFPVIVLSVMSTGAVITTANPLNRPAEIAKQAGDSKAKFVAATSSVLHKLSNLRIPLIVLPEDAEENVLTQHTSFSSCISLTDLLRSNVETVPIYQGQQDDIAALLYSSGTMGVSKGVILTHRNFIANIHLKFQITDGLPWTSRIYMCLIPMFHVYGMGWFVSGLLGKGSTIVLQQKFNIYETLEAVQRYRVTHMPLVPPVLVALAKLPTLQEYDLSSLKNVQCGAAPLTTDVITAFYARLPGVSITQGYGLTETLGVVAQMVTEEEARHLGSAGMIAANTKLKIVDLDLGKPMPPNQKGEIWIRGPTVMTGYWGKPKDMAATIDKEGWLHTGDVGYIDTDGHLFFVDRIKELIKYKGLQVAPAELEAVLLSHLDILDAAIIGYPDKEAGQIPMAFVVKGLQSDLTERDVMEFVAEQVAMFPLAVESRKFALATSNVLPPIGVNVEPRGRYRKPFLPEA